MRVRSTSARLGPLELLVVVALVAIASAASAHDAAEHADPELLNHWRTQVHLLFQWAHLVAFGLWVGGMLAATRIRGMALELLLFGSLGLFLVSLGTGTYNMEFGAATPDAPDVLSLPALSRRWPFGDAYIVLVAVKQGLLGLAVFWTLGVAARHLRWPPSRSRERLRAVFIAGTATLGLTLAAVTTMVLVLHEAIDLAPTPLHALGGVVGRLGPDELAAAQAATRAAPPPYGTDTLSPSAGWRLLLVPGAAVAAASRFSHLLGFALWLGGLAGALLVPAEARRALPLLWLGLALQPVTGAFQIGAWVPFATAPYPWRLSEMAHFRFGWTYTVLFTAKLALAAIATLGTVALSVVLVRSVPGKQASRWPRWTAALNFIVGLALAYVAVAMLLVHEGVDHAL